ncbi:uncharacterized protein LOC120414957 isoform X1 [Culex pipiens pallens]|uniref:uncharacterized protein LOC120414957 isoform X1 n=1 Tax=Culex pipiens pallens TaxID=42434 RepID=UPI0019545BF9|nr:uncharacterized protein LOC120414957 isoform X1 [Culex pipiens pallens]
MFVLHTHTNIIRARQHAHCPNFHNAQAVKHSCLLLSNVFEQLVVWCFFFFHLFKRFAKFKPVEQPSGTTLQLPPPPPLPSGTPLPSPTTKTATVARQRWNLVRGAALQRRNKTIGGNAASSAAVFKTGTRTTASRTRSSRRIRSGWSPEGDDKQRDCTANSCAQSG